MKHLRIYEEYKNELFWRTSPDEYISLLNIDVFTQKELDIIIKKVKHITKTEPSYILNTKKSQLYITLVPDEKEDNNFNIIITKAKDEWFYVIENDESYLHDINYEFYFKCDQWDGLMECLMYILKLNF